MLLVEHGKAYKNDVGWLRSAVREQLESGGTRWLESLETAGGVKAIADSHFRAKSLSARRVRWVGNLVAMCSMYR